MLREPPQNIQDKVVASVMRDLEPSAVTVHGKLGASAVVGGVLSLMVCGQFGIGMTSWADALNHAMHAHLHPVTCAVTCGILFAIFPVAILRFALSSAIQFRVLVRRHQLAMLGWFTGFGGTLTLLGEHGRTVIEFAAWVVAAVIAANVIAWIMNALMPSWQPLLVKETRRAH